MYVCCPVFPYYNNYNKEKQGSNDCYNHSDCWAFFSAVITVDGDHMETNNTLVGMF